MSEFKEIHERTIAVYETHAAGWDKHRTRFLREKFWLDKFIQSLQPGASLLDAGCGAGEPISKYLIEQRSTLQRFTERLRPAGALLLTVGHEAGEVLGTVEGEAVYHSSLSPQEYKQILGSVGFQDIEMSLKDETCDRTVLLARQYGCL